MRRSTFFNFTTLATVIVGLLVLGSLVTCGGGGGGSSSGTGTATGTVNTNISDPPTCKATFDHVWVTITRVRAHISSSAGANDGGWVDLVDLRGAPRQIDLLNLDSTTCVLTQLGSTSGILAGQYQQIRLILLSNSPSTGEATPSSNQCGKSGYNCVVPAGRSAEVLNLSSEAQTGMKIPSGQIAGGKFTVPAGRSVDLNIDFDACSSIVRQGNGQYRLKPVLHAGEVTVNNNSISGRLIDSGSKLPIANAVVLVEERDRDNPNIDRVLMQKTAGSDGRFTFCFLTAGTYDIVAAATNPAATYNATVTLSVPTGTNMGDIPLVPETAGTQAAGIGGQITTSTGSVATQVDISLSALQAVGGTNPLIVTIPLFAGSTPNVTTDACTSVTDCVGYTLFVPASNPQVGTFSATPPTSYTPPATGAVLYWVNARAFVPSSDPVTKDCSPSSLPTKFDSTTQITVSAGATFDHDLSFTGCQ
jgi:hypothetical protein